MITRQSVTLQPGESKQVFFETVPLEVRAYQVSVNGLNGSFRAEYPPSAYQFTTSVRGDYYNCGFVAPCKRYFYTITGNISPFSVVALMRDSSNPVNGYWNIIGRRKTNGPVTNFEGPSCQGEACYFECWAHPDPNRSLPEDPKEAFLDKWQRVHTGGY